jgi:Lar family restriction alleviation protein
MNNREWLNTLTNEEFAEAIKYTCKLCVHGENNHYCRPISNTCASGIAAYLAAEHIKPLKPCPFCGGNAEVAEPICGEDYFVKCVNCGCRTSYFYRAKEEAIKAWNKRPE